MRCFGQVTSTNRLSRFSRDVFLHIFYNILQNTSSVQRNNYSTDTNGSFKLDFEIHLREYANMYILDSHLASFAWVRRTWLPFTFQICVCNLSKADTVKHYRFNKKDLMWGRVVG